MTLHSYSKAPWSIVMQSKDLVIGYDKPLTRPLNLKMERNDKIAIIGANGIGKTTLLKSLMGIIKPISGLVTLDEHLDIGYYEQEAKLSGYGEIDHLLRYSNGPIPEVVKSNLCP